MADTTLSDEVQATALKSSKIVVDGQEIQRRSVDEVIKADAYVKGQSAASNGRFGLRFSRIIPPGGG